MSTEIKKLPYILNGELYRILTQIGDNVTVQCCYCPSDRIYRGSVRSTGNFHMHIKRRHPNLLDKLHEMKLAALEERREKIMQNRRFVKKRKHAEEQKSLVNHELKIRKVFQRHKEEEEQNKLEESTVRSSTPSGSNDDNNNNNTSNSNKNNNSENDTHNTSEVWNQLNVCTIVRPQDGPINNVVNFNSIVPFNQNIGQLGPNSLAVNMIQPEQKSTGTNEESIAIDLTASSSTSNNQQNIEKQLEHLSTSNPYEFAPFGCPPLHHLLMQIDNSLTQISSELQARNAIEYAKFKFLHPNFNFENFS